MRYVDALRDRGECGDREPGEVIVETREPGMGGAMMADDSWKVTEARNIRRLQASYSALVPQLI